MSQRPLVRDILTERRSDLTAAERKLAAILTDGSMVAGLQSVTRLADAAGVSSPTVIRLARKLGFDGYPELQDAIRADVAARIKQPLAKLEPLDHGAPRGHIVARFTEATRANLERTLERLDLAELDHAATILSDPMRELHFLGGRITGSNAHAFANHLRIVRPRVHMLDAAPSVWPQALIDMDEKAVLVIFDIRRYEKDLETLATLAAGQGATVILFTDLWGSPIERVATCRFRAAVEVPSSWDSTLAIGFLVEILIAEVQSRRSESSTARILALEDAIGKEKIFRGEGSR